MATESVLEKKGKETIVVIHNVSENVCGFWAGTEYPSRQRTPIIWASTRQNLSSGFPTKGDSNQSPRLQRLARKLTFRS